MIIKLKQLTSVNILETLSKISPKAPKSELKMVEMSKNHEVLNLYICPVKPHLRPLFPLLRRRRSQVRNSLKIPGSASADKSRPCESTPAHLPLLLRRQPNSSSPHLRPRSRTCGIADATAFSHLRLLPSSSNLASAITRSLLRARTCDETSAGAIMTVEFNFSNSSNFQTCSVNHPESPRGPRYLNQIYQHNPQHHTNLDKSSNHSKQHQNIQLHSDSNLRTSKLPNSTNDAETR